MPGPMDILSGVGNFVAGIPDSALSLMIGPHENLDHGERARRLIAAALVAENPANLIALQQGFQKEDLQKGAAASDPMVHKFLDERTPSVGIDQAWKDTQEAFPVLRGYKPPKRTVDTPGLVPSSGDQLDQAINRVGSEQLGVGIPQGSRISTAPREELVLPPTEFERFKVNDDSARRYFEQTNRDPRYKGKLSIDSEGKFSIVRETRTDRIVMPREEFDYRNLGELGYRATQIDVPGWVAMTPPPDVRGDVTKGIVQKELDAYAKTRNPNEVTTPEARRQLGLDAGGGAPPSTATPGAVTTGAPGSTISGASAVATPGGLQPLPGKPPLQPLTAFPGTQGTPLGSEERAVRQQQLVDANREATRAWAGQQKQIVEAKDNAAFVSATLKPLRDLIPQLPEKEYPATLRGGFNSLKRKYFDVPVAETLGLKGAEGIVKMGLIAGLAVTNIGRRFGERGVFTNQDADRFIAGLKIAGDSRDMAKTKLDTVEGLAKSVADRYDRVKAGETLKLGAGEYAIDPEEFQRRVFEGIGLDPSDVAAAAVNQERIPVPGGADDITRQELEDSLKAYGVPFETMDGR